MKRKEVSALHAEQVLHKWLLGTAVGMPGRRRQVLEAAVQAALEETTVTVTGLGWALASETDPRHGINRVDRWVDNGHRHAERVGRYGNLAQAVIGTRQRPLMSFAFNQE